MLKPAIVLIEYRHDCHDTHEISEFLRDAIHTENALRRGEYTIEIRIISTKKARPALKRAPIKKA